ncbi:hypothetical protein Q31b_38640 [Novipirellula aureliae]|uniref:Uncharacterized protein n=1 Tax=Novipirellula aureliae TaxID=2527966 RepID=A0A5C6DUQ5_9BACT|nr:hypothetical protein Q31b_38640 [Novipirellula aureliae]
MPGNSLLGPPTTMAGFRLPRDSDCREASGFEARGGTAGSKARISEPFPKRFANLMRRTVKAKKFPHVCSTIVRIGGRKELLGKYAVGLIMLLFPRSSHFLIEKKWLHVTIQSSEAV